jgi:hypothetical protein
MSRSWGARMIGPTTRKDSSVNRRRIIAAVVAVAATVGVGLVAWGSSGNAVVALEAVDPAGAEVERTEAARRGSAADVVDGMVTTLS